MRSLMDRWHGPNHDRHVALLVVLGIVVPLALAYVLAFASGVSGSSGRLNIFFDQPHENSALYALANVFVVTGFVAVLLTFIDAFVHPRRRRR